jgi:putative membrane protein
VAPVVGRVGRRYIRGQCRRALRREVELSIEGLARVPATGPAILAARHVHHKFDGCAIVASVPRPVQLLVALDWVRPGRDRRFMDWVCGAMGWPTVLRTDGPAVVEAAEARRRLRRATREAVALLREGRLLLVFPEGYPNVDPHPTPKAGLDDFLPFQPGFARLARLAERDGRTRVPIVPVGLHYERGGEAEWRVALRFGAPLFVAGADEEGAVRRVEERVRALSAR